LVILFGTVVIKPMEYTFYDLTQTTLG